MNMHTEVARRCQQRSAAGRRRFDGITSDTVKYCSASAWMVSCHSRTASTASYNTQLLL